MATLGESDVKLRSLKLGQVLVAEAKVSRCYESIWVDLWNVVFPTVGTLEPIRSLLYHLVYDKTQYLDMYGSGHGNGAYIGPIGGSPRLFMLDHDYVIQAGNLWIIAQASFYGLHSDFRGIESDSVFMQMWEQWAAGEPQLPLPKRSRVVTLLDL